jgi:predicted enzyme related to lactoylglutathione lyase
MAQMMPNTPSFWLSYVLVDDVKKTMAKARKLGATVHVEYKEIPGMGSLGMFTDPTGAMLAVWRPAPKMRASKAKPRERR